MMERSNVAKPNFMKTPNLSPSAPPPTTRQLLWWEVRWASVELAGVLFGLYFLLATRNAALGEYILWGGLSVSLAVRILHYQKSLPRMQAIRVKRDE
jgi:hypothetical protein